jgi:hypothetical protein
VAGCCYCWYAVISLRLTINLTSVILTNHTPRLRRAQRLRLRQRDLENRRHNRRPLRRLPGRPETHRVRMERRRHPHHRNGHQRPRQRRLQKRRSPPRANEIPKSAALSPRIPRPTGNRRARPAAKTQCAEDIAVFELGAASEQIEAVR